jgi:hypothetical protein
MLTNKAGYEREKIACKMGRNRYPANRREIKDVKIESSKDKNRLTSYLFSPATVAYLNTFRL